MSDSNRRLKKVAAGVLFLGLVAIALLMVIIAVPSLVGADESYVVLSGSMEPAMSPGDVVIVREVDPASIETGDVISFRRERDGTGITHRVIDIQSTDDSRQFIVKGDANEEADPEPVMPSDVIGRVLVVIPFAGHLVLFTQSRFGILALVIIPGVLLVLNELLTLYKASGQ